jgi:hypothetical protein
MSSDLGKFSHTVLGYDSAPAVSQIVLYWTYTMLAVTAYFAVPLISKPRRRTPAQIPAEQVDAAQPGG